MKSCVPNLSEIIEVCKRYNVTIIEDSAEVVGYKYKGKMVGTFGKVGVLSFQSNKILDSGEGGALFTDDKHIISKATIFSGVHEDNGMHHYYYDELKSIFDTYDNNILSYSMRMTELVASILNAQFPDLMETLTHVKNIYSIISKNLNKDFFLFHQHQKV